VCSCEIDACSLPEVDKLFLSSVGSTRAGPDALKGETPAASVPDAGNNLTPAPDVGNREELQNSKSDEMKAEIYRDKSGAAAEQGASISQQDPSQPLQAAVPKCQVSILAHPAPALKGGFLLLNCGKEYVVIGLLSLSFSTGSAFMPYA